MATRNRDACSRERYRTPNRCGDHPFYATGVPSGEELEDASIVYQNVMFLADSLADGDPYEATLKNDDDRQIHVHEYSAEVYVDIYTGKIDAIDFDGSVAVDEIARDATRAKIMFRATVEEEFSAQVEDGFRGTALNFEFDPGLSHRAANNLNETLRKYQEQ